MRHVAIIGSGPAGYYSAEALQKLYGEGVAIDMIDRLPVPYGLIRSGVAPDHQSIKAVTRRYGPAPESFVVVPIVGAFFVDLMNLAVLTFFLIPGLVVGR